MLSALKSQLFAARNSGGSPAEDEPQDDAEVASIFEKRATINSRPSNVSWLPPSRSEPSLDLYAPSIGRSASSPSLLSDVQRRPRPHRRGSFSHTRGPPEVGKPLSPVMEKREEIRSLSLEPIDNYPSAFPIARFPTEEGVPSPSSAYSAFIRRPLKRTVSQTSSLRTLRTGRSIAAPSLPPLALGQNLSDAVSVIATPTPTSQPPAGPSPLKQWAQPPSAVTPSVTRHLNDRVHAHDPFSDPRSSWRPSLAAEPSVLDDDTRSLYARSLAYMETQSIAARSVLAHGDAHSMMAGADTRSMMDEDADADADAEDSAEDNPVPEVVSRPQPELTRPPRAVPRISFVPQLERGTSSMGTPMPLSTTVGTHSLDPSTAYITSIGTSPRAGPSTQRVPPAPAVQATLSNSSSFIDRHWRFGRWSTASARRSAYGSLLEKLPDNIRYIDKVKLLFWLGFIAGPWCWLIGGWLIRDRLPRAQTTPILPLWIADQARQNAAADGSHAEDVSAVFKMDPWVRRCRLAAAISSCLLVVALLLATIVLTTMH